MKNYLLPLALGSVCLGGLAREFYVRIARHYARPEAWTWQERNAYRGVGQSATAAGESTQWTFEPGVAANVFQDWIAEAGLDLLFPVKTS